MPIRSKHASCDATGQVRDAGLAFFMVGWIEIDSKIKSVAL